MSSDLKQKPAARTVNLNEIAQRSTTKDNIALRIEEGLRLERLQREIERRRRRNRAVRGIILLTAILALAGFGYWQYRRSATPSEEVLRSTDSTPESAADIAIVDKEVEHRQTEGYILTKATIKPVVGEPLDLYTYDFYSNQFLYDANVLSDPTAMKNVLSKLRKDKNLRDRLPKSWVLIFAGASCEGTVIHNLTLSGERVEAVKKMMSDEWGIPSFGYWGLAVGEYVNVPEDKRPWCEDKSHESQGPKEVWLQEQRRLIVAVITPRAPVPQESSEKALKELTSAFYKNDLLPSDYELAVPGKRIVPVPLDLSANPKSAVGF